MIDALIKRVSVSYTCYEIYVHRGKKVQLLVFKYCSYTQITTILTCWLRIRIMYFIPTERSRHGRMVVVNLNLTR
jgi:hypothetical protein